MSIHDFCGKQFDEVKHSICFLRRDLVIFVVAKNEGILIKGNLSVQCVECLLGTRWSLVRVKLVTNSNVEITALTFHCLFEFQEITPVKRFPILMQVMVEIKPDNCEDQ